MTIPNPETLKRVYATLKDLPEDVATLIRECLPERPSLADLKWDSREMHMQEAVTKYGRVVGLLRYVYADDADGIIITTEGNYPDNALYPTGRKLKLVPDDPEPAPEPLPAPEDCEPDGYYLVASRDDRWVGVRRDPSVDLEWTLICPDGYARAYDDQVTILARLLPDREV